MMFDNCVGHEHRQVSRSSVDQLSRVGEQRSARRPCDGRPSLPHRLLSWASLPRVHLGHRGHEELCCCKSLYYMISFINLLKLVNLPTVSIRKRKIWSFTWFTWYWATYLKLYSRSEIIRNFCFIQSHKIKCIISLFAENTFTVITYFDILENSNPHLETNSDKFIYQQDGAPPHWNLHVKEFLNARLPQRWIGLTVPNDSA